MTCKVTEAIISRLTTVLSYASPKEIVDILAAEGIEGYDAWLAYKAAEVCVKMACREQE